MAEGGFFAWKHQTVDNRRGPAGSYRNLHRPLPEPPKDMHWIQDLDTREWQLTKIIVPSTGLLGDEELVDVKEAVAMVDESDIPRIVLHKLLPTDTFQGLCLKYKITPTELRRANGGFSGTNLHLAPDPLQIPINSKYLKKEQQLSSSPGDTSPAQKIRHVQIAVPSLSKSEAKCYLELNDWSVEKAVENAKEDDGF